MNYRWSEKSLMHLATCVPELRAVAHRALEMSPFDLCVTESHRDEQTQTALYAQGRTAPGKIVTKVEWPNSKHNTVPSLAVHIDPFPIDYDDWKKYYVLAGVVWVAAIDLGLRDGLRWGGDWDGDFKYNDQTFNDLAHWEWVG